MPSPEENQRRKELQRQVRQQERARLDASLPMPREQLSGLCDHLDQALAPGCDHTLRFTRDYLRGEGLSEDRILPWLVELGGGCEVLANVEEHFPSE
jgi:hypothetical protein